MENLTKHKEEFEKIIKKYDLNSKNKASEISLFLLSKGNISVEEFSTKFEIPKKESKIFMEFIMKGIKFRESLNSKRKEL